MFHVHLFLRRACGAESISWHALSRGVFDRVGVPLVFSRRSSLPSFVFFPGSVCDAFVCLSVCLSPSALVFFPLSFLLLSFLPTPSASAEAVSVVHVCLMCDAGCDRFPPFRGGTGDRTGGGTRRVPPRD